MTIVTGDCSKSSRRSGPFERTAPHCSTLQHMNDSFLAGIIVGAIVYFLLDRLADRIPSR